jgi:hypothetical protein
MRAPDHGAIRRDRTQPMLIAAALTLMVVVLWLVTHRYRGIDNDAQLYAFQALERTHPALSADLYLQNTSQDNYSVFSPFYSATIGLFGLQNATMMLTILFTAGFLIASWILARDLLTSNVAWLAVCAMTIIPGAYGAAGIFHFSDNFLTARLPAEALVSIALVCFFRGSRLLALTIAIAALFVHPLMALPGLLLLICVWLPYPARIVAFSAGILAVLAMALAVLAWPAAAQRVGLMDVAWLEVVRERSHFLFLQLWTTSDWALNARPFICLIITMLVAADERIRRLSMAALLIGAAGLAVALIASSIAPIALLIQGQAWRWVWITTFVSILLLVPTVLQIWRNERCGPICAILLIAGWTWPLMDGTACVSVALILWLIRDRITERIALFLRWTAYAIGIIAVCWALGNSWTIFTSSPAESGREPLLLGRIRNIAGLEIPAALVIGFFWHWILAMRSLAAKSAVVALLFAAAVYILPKSFNQLPFAGSPAQIAEFDDWRAAIPETSNVFVADRYDPGSFVWFTLGRLNYLTIDQSAGVVFSRKTALEVKRRSQILLPLMDPDWKLLTVVRLRAAGQKSDSPPYRPLTAQNLLDVCADPQLGFVIAKENVGFSPLRHTHAGPWKDWNLYDCLSVRAGSPQA